MVNLTEREVGWTLVKTGWNFLGGKYDLGYLLNRSENYGKSNQKYERGLKVQKWVDFALGGK